MHGSTPWHSPFSVCNVCSTALSLWPICCLNKVRHLNSALTMDVYSLGADLHLPAQPYQSHAGHVWSKPPERAPPTLASPDSYIVLTLVAVHHAMVVMLPAAVRQDTHALLLQQTAGSAVQQLIWHLPVVKASQHAVSFYGTLL